MGEKHSAVGYLFREGAFLPAQETKPVRNEFGLDLFQHRGSVYEGKTGLHSVLSSKRRTWPVSLRSMAVLKKSKS